MEKEEIGIKETKEVLDAVLCLSICMVEVFKDGFDISDISTLMGDPKIAASAKLAFENIGQLPAEMKDIDLSEGLELAQCVLVKIPDLIAAIKKEA